MLTLKSKNESETLKVPQHYIRCWFHKHWASPLYTKL